MAGNGPNILVAADDGRERARIAAAIEEAGFAVVAAAGSFAALRALAQREFAALVLAPLRDDGGDLLRQARLRRPGLPVLLVLPPAQQPSYAADATIARRPLDPRRLLGCIFELVLRDGECGGGPHSRAAELSIAAAQLACLDNRRILAEQAGRGSLARDLTRQIGRVRTACRALSRSADRVPTIM